MLFVDVKIKIIFTEFTDFIFNSFIVVIIYVMSASTQKKKHIKAVRPKLRAKEPLLGVFMWGINYSASSSTILLRKWLCAGTPVR